MGWRWLMSWPHSRKIILDCLVSIKQISLKVEEAIRVCASWWLLAQLWPKPILQDLQGKKELLKTPDDQKVKVSPEVCHQITGVTGRKLSKIWTVRKSIALVLMVIKQTQRTPGSSTSPSICDPRKYMPCITGSTSTRRTWRPRNQKQWLYSTHCLVCGQGPSISILKTQTGGRWGGDDLSYCLWWRWRASSQEMWVVSKRKCSHAHILILA